MKLNEYQAQAMTTCMQSSDNDVYAFNGMVAEVGEIQDKIAKWVRKGWMDVDGCDFMFNGVSAEGAIALRAELITEVGDVLWFVALASKRLDYTLEEVAEINLSKLASRKARGVIDGSGDNR